MNTPVPPRGPKRKKPAKRASGKGGAGKAPARGKQAAYQRQRKQKQLAIGGVALVVVVVVVLVIVFVTGSSSSSSSATADTAAPATLVSQVTGVTAKAMAEQANADTVTYPTATGAAELTVGGKPEVVYMGAEYCPYCAGERWAIVMALSKFGTFHNLQQVTSESSDTVASVPSFSFYGSSYTSDYLDFSTTELETVSGAKLQTPTKANEALLTKYDSAGSIPFVDIGGKWVIVGASYNDSAMAHLTHATVAAAVASGGTKYGADIQATAGMITSRLCSLTGGKPGNVCKYFPKVIGS